jgi:hypothetical protein
MLAPLPSGTKQPTQTAAVARPSVPSVIGASGDVLTEIAAPARSAAGVVPEHASAAAAVRSDASNGTAGVPAAASELSEMRAQLAQLMSMMSAMQAKQHQVVEELRALASSVVPSTTASPGVPSSSNSNVIVVRELDFDPNVPPPPVPIKYVERENTALKVGEAAIGQS